MRSSTSGTSRLLSTEDPASQIQWSNLLELQIAQFFPYELHFLLGSKRWATRNRVLDAGCGSGRYIAELRRFFPEKTYAGLDISKEHIAAAQEDDSLRGIDFVCGDFFAYEPSFRFDAVLMRLIVQHMKGLTDIFEKLDKLISSDGSVYIIEPAPALFRNFPPTPLFEKLLYDYTAATAKTKINRAQLTTLEQGLAQIPGWIVADKATLTAPQVGPFEATALSQIFRLWIDIFERSQVVECDFEIVRRELDTWAANPATYNQIGLAIFELRPSKAARRVGAPAD